jgi:hypothetical protein
MEKIPIKQGASTCRLLSRASDLGSGKHLELIHPAGRAHDTIQVWDALFKLEPTPVFQSPSSHVEGYQHKRIKKERSQGNAKLSTARARGITVIISFRSTRLTIDH